MTDNDEIRPEKKNEVLVEVESVFRVLGRLTERACSMSSKAAPVSAGIG